MPLPSVKKSITYDSNSPKSVLKSIIQNIEYQTDIGLLDGDISKRKDAYQKTLLDLYEKNTEKD